MEFLSDFLDENINSFGANGANMDATAVKTAIMDEFAKNGISNIDTQIQALITNILHDVIEEIGINLFVVNAICVKFIHEILDDVQIRSHIKRILSNDKVAAAAAEINRIWNEIKKTENMQRLIQTLKTELREYIDVLNNSADSITIVLMGYTKTNIGKEHIGLLKSQLITYLARITPAQIDAIGPYMLTYLKTIDGEKINEIVTFVEKNTKILEFLKLTDPFNDGLKKALSNPEFSKKGRYILKNVAPDVLADAAAAAPSPARKKHQENEEDIKSVMIDFFEENPDVADFVSKKPKTTKTIASETLALERSKAKAKDDIVSLAQSHIEFPNVRDLRELATNPKGFVRENHKKVMAAAATSAAKKRSKSFSDIATLNREPSFSNIASAAAAASKKGSPINMNMNTSGVTADQINKARSILNTILKKDNFEKIEQYLSRNPNTELDNFMNIVKYHKSIIQNVIRFTPTSVIVSVINSKMIPDDYKVIIQIASKNLDFIETSVNAILKALPPKKGSPSTAATIRNGVTNIQNKTKKAYTAIKNDPKTTAVVNRTTAAATTAAANISKGISKGKTAIAKSYQTSSLKKSVDQTKSAAATKAAQAKASFRDFGKNTSARMGSMMPSMPRTGVSFPFTKKKKDVEFSRIGGRGRGHSERSRRKKRTTRKQRKQRK